MAGGDARPRSPRTERRSAPHVHGDATLVEMLDEQEQAWNERPLLRSLYREWFAALAARMSRVPGVSVELGSGIGRFREVAPSIVTTDVEPTPWTSRVADATELPFADGEVANLVLDRRVSPRRSAVALPRRGDASARARVAASLVLDPVLLARLDAALPSVPPRAHRPRRVAPFADDERVGSAPLASNQARATLAFFRASDELAARWPQLHLVERKRLALLAYPLSGGFSGRRLVPDGIGRALQRAEGALGWAAPLFAFRCLVVLERRG